MAGRSIATWTIPYLPDRLLKDVPKRLDVSDPALSNASVTHSSFHGLSTSSSSLEPGPAAVDYEKLEFVGVTIISSAVTMVLHKLFPWLRSGPSTILRNQVCSNQVLSQVSARLGLPKLLQAHPAQIAHLRDNPSIQAGLFQAHIGALATTDQKGIGVKSEISVYLEKIFEPIVRWAFTEMKEHHQGVVGVIGIKRSSSQRGRDAQPTHDEIDRAAVGAKNTLDTFFSIPSRGSCKVICQDTHPPFRAICDVLLANGNIFTTSATRTKKKLAVAAAAWEMCGQLLLPRGEVGE